MVNKTIIKLIFSAAILSLSAFPIYGKKIKQSLKISKKTSDIKKNRNSDNLAEVDGFSIEIGDSDTASFIKNGEIYTFLVSSIQFSGYDKSATASKESFHIVNKSGYNIQSLTIKIIYKDMNGRMLHSRETVIKKEIPHNETRKIDISSWDIQKSFYYYLSNEPRRVAQPYQVSITPLNLYITE